METFEGPGNHFRFSVSVGHCSFRGIFEGCDCSDVISARAHSCFVVHLVEPPLGKRKNGHAQLIRSKMPTRDVNDTAYMYLLNRNTCASRCTQTGSGLVFPFGGCPRCSRQQSAGVAISSARSVAYTAVNSASQEITSVFRSASTCGCAGWLASARIRKARCRLLRTWLRAALQDEAYLASKRAAKAYLQ